MVADHPGMIARFDCSVAVDGHLFGPGLDRDQRHVVVMLVLVLQLLTGVAVIHRPVEHRLALRLLRSQAQPLQRVGDRLVEAVAGDVADRQAHGSARLLTAGTGNRRKSPRRGTRYSG